MAKNRILIALVVMSALAAAGAAAAQAPTPGDTTVVGEGGGVKLVPSYNGRIEGRVEFVSLENRFSRASSIR
ncbi:MAG: hypothetical protein H6Q78_1098 [Candidatus Krumholzibacteriota bacterium]|nr:hypothetical protein [Candidatus Krumholzibacteriota bacterium]